MAAEVNEVNEVSFVVWFGLTQSLSSGGRADEKRVDN